MTVCTTALQGLVKVSTLSLCKFGQSLVGMSARLNFNTHNTIHFQLPWGKGCRGCLQEHICQRHTDGRHSPTVNWTGLLPFNCWHSRTIDRVWLILSGVDRANRDTCRVATGRGAWAYHTTVGPWVLFYHLVFSPSFKAVNVSGWRSRWSRSVWRRAQDRWERTAAAE